MTPSDNPTHQDKESRRKRDWCISTEKDLFKVAEEIVFQQLGAAMYNCDDPLDGCQEMVSEDLREAVKTLKDALAAERRAATKDALEMSEIKELVSELELARNLVRYKGHTGQHFEHACHECNRQCGAEKALKNFQSLRERYK